MTIELTVDEIKRIGAQMVAILGLKGSPVGVRVLPPGMPHPDGAEGLVQHRYCQAVTKARHGHDVVVDAEGISFSAAAAAFGFRPLPPAQLRSGKGLVGSGIVSDTTYERNASGTGSLVRWGRGSAVRQLSGSRCRNARSAVHGPWRRMRS